MHPLKRQPGVYGLVVVLIVIAASSDTFAAGGPKEEVLAGPAVLDYRNREIRIPDASRIVTLGGAITEIVFALGAESQIVGTDLSSTHPPAVSGLPIVGYHRRITAEGVLSVQPSLVIASTESGPLASFRLIRDAGTTVLILPDEFSVAGIRDKIRRIGEALDREVEAEAMIRKLEEDIDRAALLVGAVTSRPQVLFVYARGGSVLMVAGRDNQAATMLELSGADNAGARFRGFRPLTAESVAAANPNVLLMLTGGFESLGGLDGILDLPGVALTDAGRDRNIIHLDDNYLLGFGPRMGLAVLDLINELHPEVRAE